MRYPKLKQAGLCRVLPYAVVLGGFLLPVILVWLLPVVPEAVKALVTFGVLIALLVYLYRNFLVLMALDMTLAMLRCRSAARTRYDLPPDSSASRIEKRVSRYGTKCAPAPILPQPTDLRYRFGSSNTIYARGIEKVVAVYRADLLDADTYRAIFSSAKTNSQALTGRKKPLLLDKAQKKSPLNRVTVIVILAKRVDTGLSGKLYEFVCKQCGDAYEDSIVPCVIDMEHQACVFNSLREPYVGLAYPVKNRGIRLVKKLVFGGRIRLNGNDCFLDPVIALDPETSLWDFWKELRYECVLSEKEITTRFEGMADREILFIEDTLYIKWGDQGIILNAELDPEQKKAKVEPIECWSYPKANPIGKKTIRELRQAVTDYFAGQCYAAEFTD